MPPRPPLALIVITLNEEQNIAQCIRSCAGMAEELLVVDSGSSDRTRSVAAAEGALVVDHSWEGYGQQKNWAMTQVKSPWVLFLDADERLSEELRREIGRFLDQDGEGCFGASFPRKTSFLGRWILHGGWYPNRLVRLGRRDHCRWTEPELHEALEVRGGIRKMQGDLLHFTFRDVGENVLTNVRFSRLGARLARRRGETGSYWRIFLKPLGKFLETYFWKRGFLDGFPGLVISLNAAHSQFMKYVELRFGNEDSHH